MTENLPVLSPSRTCQSLFAAMRSAPDHPLRGPVCSRGLRCVVGYRDPSSATSYRQPPFTRVHETHVRGPAECRNKDRIRRQREGAFMGTALTWADAEICRSTQCDAEIIQTKL